MTNALASDVCSVGYLSQDPKTGADEFAYVRAHGHVCVRIDSEIANGVN